MRTIRIHTCGVDKTDQSKVRPIKQPQSVREQAPPTANALSGGVVRINSKQLFGGAGEVEINHNGTPYRLKQTSLGKLILTK
jgi:hemin uptake protein HemP